MEIRRAEERDAARITELLYQVQKDASDGRPDLFVAGAEKIRPGRAGRNFEGR